MATVTSVAVAVPPYSMPCDTLKQAVLEHVQSHFHFEARRTAALMSIFDNALIEQRYSVMPLDALKEPISLTQTSEAYRLQSVQLGEKVVLDCLEQANMRPADVDVLITVSCTGVMLPSLDAYLIARLGFRSNVRRLPVTELGCVAGAVALSLAHDFIKARPTANVLIVSVELPTLTFQRDDYSLANLVSMALFGDGAAAALVVGTNSGSIHGARLLDTEAFHFPNALDAIGFDLKDNGLHIVLSDQVPNLVRQYIEQPVSNILARHNLTTKQITSFLLHPGGRKLLEYLEAALEVTRDQSLPSWEIMRDFGNLSSASILFVLREWLVTRQPAADSYGLIAAFGPGLSAELLLIQWK